MPDQGTDEKDAHLEIANGGEGLVSVDLGHQSPIEPVYAEPSVESRAAACRGGRRTSNFLEIPSAC